MNTFGLWLIRLTIWLAVSAWLLRVFVEASGRSFAARDRMIRWGWLIGALACVAHVIAAMGFGHCWSLENAMRHTALETRRVIGIELPWSVFVNFAFAGLWEPGNFAVITVDANPAVARVHDRMPAILSADAEGEWLDPKTTPAHARGVHGEHFLGVIVAPPIRRDHRAHRLRHRHRSELLRPSVSYRRARPPSGVIA